METPTILPLALDDPFQFRCHQGLSCFNECCRDLNQALTPYDVLRIRTFLGLTWPDFLQQFAHLHAGPTTGLPVVSLRFPAEQEYRCPFVNQTGCRIYEARPTSCRLYPVARGVCRSKTDGSLKAQFVLVYEPHCGGFKEPHTQTVRDWLDAQHAASGIEAGDALLDIVTLKSRLGDVAQVQSRQKWILMALYDLETLKKEAAAARLPAMNGAVVPPLPDADDDMGWLSWGIAWIGNLFSTETAV